MYLQHLKIGLKIESVKIFNRSIKISQSFLEHKFCHANIELEK